MSVESKPVFRSEVMRPQVRSFNLPAEAGACQPKLQHWAGLIASGRADEIKETELLPEFLSDIFCGLLGYTGPAEASGDRVGCRGLRPDTLPHHRACGFPHTAVERSFHRHGEARSDGIQNP